MRSMCQDVAYQLVQQATQAEAVSCKLHFRFDIDVVGKQVPDSSFK